MWSQILQDTGAAQSFILDGVLPLSDQYFGGTHILCRGFVPNYFKAPLHVVHLKSDLVEGTFKVGVCSEMPVAGISFILGNDIAREKVLPMLEVSPCCESLLW